MRRAIVYVLFLLSGAAGLGYEIVWTRMFATGLGHELPSALAIVAALFAGLALGAGLLDRRVSTSAVPGRWYAGCELAVAAWGLVSMVLVPRAGEWVAALTGPTPGPLRHWAVAFAVPLVTLLPATAAMGATLPAMDRLLARLRGQGRSLGAVYAANTAGAVAGVLGTTFLLVPALGYRATLAVLVAANVVCAAGVLLGPARGEAAKPEVVAALDALPTRRRLAATVFATGLLGIGYEVLGVRVMAQVLENTVYSFAAALAVYLLGTALGAAAYQRWAAHRPHERLLERLLLAQVATCLLGVVPLAGAKAIYTDTRAALGGGLAASVTAELVLAALVFLPATAVMGALFSHLAQGAREARGGVGRALALNTCGAALAPALAGVGLLPAVGARGALLAVALAYLALLPRPSTTAFVGAGAAAVAALLLPADLTHVEAPPGGSIRAVREGVLATVAVVDGPQGHRYLKVNDRFLMGGTRSAFGEKRQGHVPLLLHAQPRRALLLGVGTGITATAVAAYPQLEAVAVELIPEVVELVPAFHAPADDPVGHPRVEIVVGDARRYVRATRERFDVIVADLFHPARDGSGSLYTAEHFAAVRERLAPGGLFCQWLPLYQLDAELLRTIVRTFLAEFPDARAFLAHFNVETPALGLVAGDGARRYAPGWMEDRVRDPGLREALTTLALADDWRLFGTFFAGPDALAAFAGSGPLNTDDRPLVTFAAPRVAYADPGAPYVLLAELLDTVRAAPEALLADATAARRLGAYVAARDAYLRAEIARSRGDAAAALAGYLDSVRRSSDFRTGYFMAIAAARPLVRRSPDEARRVLETLIGLRPEWPEAKRYLEEWFGSSVRN